MKNWKVIVWSIVGLAALLTLPVLYILVAMQLDPEPDSFNRENEPPFGGGLGHLTTEVRPWKL